MTRRRKVVYRSAIVASCSLPLVLPPSVLYTRPRRQSAASTLRRRTSRLRKLSSSGIENPDLGLYAPPNMRFVDGSILQDIPLTELQTVFNVKSCVVSQVNPHFTPFVSGPLQYGKARTKLGSVLESLWSYLALDLRNRYARLLMLALVPKIRGQDVSHFLLQVSARRYRIKYRSEWRRPCHGCTD